AGAIAAGLLLATAWPHHSPFEAIARTGNPSWTGGLEFYSAKLLFMAGVPALIGLWGLCHPRFARDSRPVLLAFVGFAAIFAAGAYGPMIATRFVMPAVLMLHVGMGALFIVLGEKWRSMRKASQLGLFGFAVACFNIHVAATVAHLNWEAGVSRETGDAHAAAQALTADIPDAEPVAAYDVAAWPVVATGQRAVSVPWPEPMIADLAERQAAAERLFNPKLSREERLGLARQWGVRRLIIDRRGPIRRLMPDGLLKVLDEQAASRRESGTFIRFDLE
ncbi:MAG TPA: hypothetical protein VN231_05475, partial [Allosphingosinicella sp.]|nr:hypothetical protein [Allosphingosinicella sp.]